MRKQEGNFAVLKRIFSYLTPFRSQLGIIIVCLLTSALIGFFKPLIIRKITDDGMMQLNMKVILYSVLILLVLVICEQINALLQSKLFVNIHNKFCFSLYHQAFGKLLHLKTCYYSDKNSSEIVNSVALDVNNVSAITERYCVVTLGYLFTVISGIVGLFIINWKLTLVVVAMIPIKYLIVKSFSKRREKNNEETIELNRDFSSWFGDNIGGIKEIKLWNLYGQRYNILKQKQGKILENNKKNAILDAKNQFCQVLLEWSISLGLYIMGGLLICNGTLTIGSVFAFISYSGYVIGPISVIMNLRYYIAKIIPSAKRLFKFLDLEEENNSQGVLPAESNKININFSHVSFSYDDSKRVLNNVNFSINEGEKIAIIGANGSGKTTILSLILRFYEPTSGTIYVNDIDSAGINLNEYRNLFSVVSQDPYLFYDTVVNNIDLGGKLEKEQIEQACKQSGAYKFIEHLPEKHNSKIGNNGAKLSGGEKQKLTVARAMVKDSPIVILDEATSGYDVKSDAYLHDVLLRELDNKTVIMITHRYDNLEGMDRIYRLDHGMLSEIQKQDVEKEG